MMSHTEETAKMFRERLQTSIQGAFLSMAISTGVKLELFDMMASFNEPKTSEEIATFGHFKERYVREWLGTMVTANIFALDQTGSKFYFPEDKRSAILDFASRAWLVPMCAGIEPQLLECFKIDGPPGVPQERFAMFEGWRELSMKADFRWSRMKPRLKEVPGLWEMLEAGINILDAGCSVGIAACQIATNFPNTTVHALDVSEDAIYIGMLKAKQMGLKNVQFHVEDLCDKFDYIYSLDTIHDISHCTRALQEINRCLKPSGYFTMMEMNLHSDLKSNIGKTWAPYMYSLSLFHCLATSLTVPGSEGVGACWGKEKMKKCCHLAGFTTVQYVAESICRIHVLSQK